MSSVVPEGWVQTLIGDIGSFFGGLTGKTAKDFGDGHPFLTYMQVFLQKTSDKDRVNFVSINESEKQNRVDYGDILFTTSSETPNEIGMTAVFLEEDWSPYLNSFCFGLRVESPSSIDPLFAKYVLRGDKFREDMRPLAQGSTRFNLSKGNLAKLNLLLPSLPEQKKIASILTSVDEVVENTQKQIDKLQDLKKATMNELLTKGIGHTEFKDSELGRIPKSWEVIALAELLELKNGLNTNADAFGSGSPFLSYKDIYKDTELTERSLSQKVEVSERENNSFSVNYGDVFFTRTSETPEEIGFANVYLGANVGAVFNGFCIRGRPITNKLSVRLSRFLFRSDYVRVQMRFLCKYTTRAGISGESLNRCLLAVPPIDEQEKYLKTLNSIEKMIKAAGKKLSQTQSLKKSLMQDLLTGKVRVTVN